VLRENCFRSEKVCCLKTLNCLRSNVYRVVSREEVKVCGNCIALGRLALRPVWQLRTMLRSSNRQKETGQSLHHHSAMSLAVSQPNRIGCLSCRGCWENRGASGFPCKPETSACTQKETSQSPTLIHAQIPSSCSLSHSLSRTTVVIAHRRTGTKVVAKGDSPIINCCKGRLSTDK
jgi:hypothetical protein